MQTVSPPPWPADLMCLPHIPIGPITRLCLFHGEHDPIPGYLTFFGEFAEWAAAHEVGIGAYEDSKRHDQLWLAGYCADQSTLLTFHREWQPLLWRYLWLYAARSRNWPLIVPIRPKAAHMVDVEEFLPIHMPLRNTSISMLDEPGDNWNRVAKNPMAILIDGHDHALALRTEQDAVLARLCGFS